VPSGGLLCLIVEALLLEESSFLEPLVAAIGAATVAAGHRWLSNALRTDRRLSRKW
jgi:hypothetical protein